VSVTGSEQPERRRRRAAGSHAAGTPKRCTVSRKRRARADEEAETEEDESEEAEEEEEGKEKEEVEVEESKCAKTLSRDCQFSTDGCDVSAIGENGDESAGRVKEEEEEEEEEDVEVGRRAGSRM